MDNREAQFLKRLEAVFKIETEEHIQLLSSLLLELEKTPELQRSIEITESMFREAHSLKGAARSVNRSDIESICRILENIFSKMKNNHFVLAPEHFDKIHQAIEHISQLMSAKNQIKGEDHQRLIELLQSIIESGKTHTNGPAHVEINIPRKIEEQQYHPKKKKPISKSIVTQAKSDDFTSKDKPIIQEHIKKVVIDSKTSLSSETVRIETAKLDPLFLQAEQLIQAKIAAIQRVSETKDLLDFIRNWKSELRDRLDQKSLNNLTTLKEIINCNQTKQNELEGNVDELLQSIENDQRVLSRMIDEHLDAMKSILMLPISVLTEGFPKLVRDLARSQKKEVELIISGQEIEVDKRILQDLKDPLIHILRNCVDHGLETRDKRLKQNKTAQGTIRIDFSTADGRNLNINVSDDGIGINETKVIAASIKAGIVDPSEQEKLNKQDSLSLIFNSGLTTSPLITDISGRGLGLAIAKEKVDSLNGSISVSSTPNEGTTFILIVPLTLSTLRGVLVNCEDHQFLIPSINVKHVLRVPIEKIKTVENRDTIIVNDEIIALVKLGTVLGLKPKLNNGNLQKNNIANPSSYIQIIVLSNANHNVAFVVDEVKDERQILVKDLGKQLKNVLNISGVTVLGSGLIVPVINVSDLMKSSLKVGRTRILNEEVKPIEKSYKILVTEDSITSRTLIKDILETAGYLVETAVDGLDGYTKASIGEFDLIVSDVDMPRMNGFELTTKIRGDKKLSELPVILVTALDSREDREHGIDVGANAYIIKNSFDQSNLLEVVQKLL